MEQRDLAERLQLLQTDKEHHKNNTNKTKLKEIQNGINEVQNMLSNSTQNLARYKLIYVDY